jgi:hypothetical protein
MSCRTKLLKVNYQKLQSREAVRRTGVGAPGCRALPNVRLQNRGFGLLFQLRSEFCNYAVGPWVSVAGREAALARGNPAKKIE